MSTKFVLNETSYFGKGAREELAGEINKRGFKKVLVVTDKALLEVLDDKLIESSFDLYKRRKWILEKIVEFDTLLFHGSVVAVDGHDFDELENAFAEARRTKGAPTAIVMTTVKGKGVSYMENNAGWHGKAPNDAEYAQAMTELKAKLAELEA